LPLQPAILISSIPEPDEKGHFDGTYDVFRLFAESSAALQRRENAIDVIHQRQPAPQS
jgi:hypothetical protein